MTESMELERYVQREYERLPEHLQNIRKGPEGRKLRSFGHQLFVVGGVKTYTKFTQFCLDVLNVARFLGGLCKNDAVYHHQEDLIERCENAWKYTPNPNPRERMFRPTIVDPANILIRPVTEVASILT